MFENNITTGVPEWDTINNSEPVLSAQPQGPSAPLSDDDSVTFVADGGWVDPRMEVTGRYVQNHGECLNKWNKLQRSIMILDADGNSVLVSAFGAKTKSLTNLKLGVTYSFKGMMKEKTETYQGQERTSRFLNL